jgi:hypothetical protein
MKRLLGLPKLLKQPHVLELDIEIDNKLNYTIQKKSYNQKETVIFLKKFNQELEILKKKTFNLSEDYNKIQLIKTIFNDNGNFVLYDEKNKKMYNELHLINMRIITKKKTVEFKNIEKKVNSIFNNPFIRIGNKIE